MAAVIPIVVKVAAAAAIGGVTSSLAGGDFGKGAVTGALAGAVTMGVSSAIGSVSNAGAGAGAGGSAASTAAPLGEGLGTTTLGKQVLNVAGSEIAGLAETSKAALSSLGSEGAKVAGLGTQTATSGGGLLGGAADKISAANSWAGEEIAKAGAVKGAEQGGGLWNTAKDWWSGMDAAKQGNWMDLAGDTVGGIGKALFSGMQAEDERSWREKMYERMQRDNTIDFNRNDTPSTQGYRVADNYQVIPRWLQDRIGRK